MSQSPSKSDLQRLIDVCQAAVDATISQTAFEADWPHRQWPGELLTQIRDDVEDGVIHAPGNLWRKGVNTDLWESSFEHFKIEVGREMLARLVQGADEADLILERQRRLNDWRGHP